MKSIVVLLMFAATAGLVPSASAEPSPTPVALERAGEVMSSLLRAHPAGGDGLANGVTELLMGDPSAATAVAIRSKKLNCDQAAAVALGVSRAIAASEKTDSARVKKIYGPFEQACGNCRGRDRDGREEKLRMCRAEEKPDFSEPTRIRNSRGEDCFCALIAGLAAQIYAQGEAGSRMGFFADELSGNGGAGGIGRWTGNSVSGN